MCRLRKPCLTVMHDSRHGVGQRTGVWPHRACARQHQPPYSNSCHSASASLNPFPIAVGGCHPRASRRLLVLWLLVQRLHRGEEQHLLDGVVVSHQHGQPVDTHAPARRRRQAVLEGLAEVLVDEHGLVVARVLVLGLPLEALALVDGVVELSVRVAHLVLVGEEFEALGEPGVLAVLLGERRHDLGVVADEGGVDALGLEELAHQLVEHSRRRLRWLAFNLVLEQHLLEKIAGLIGVHVGEFDAQRLLESLDHWYPLERRREVDLDLRHALASALGVVFDLVRAVQVHDHLGEHLLGEGHQVVIVGVRPVELARGELGIVRHVHPLVAEEASNLVYAVEAADDEHLEVKLGCHAHVQVAVEVVVVRDEGFCGGASGDHVHHRCLHLQEAVHVEEATHEIDDLGARHEDIARRGVEDEVQVALAVARLLVDQTVGGLGHHV
mmetsp:Transcript_7271/g.14551  ORF Transcript_7271/g.14551 Transcript_7271/m.14551 type:complete len:441 (-) Transcript_7271:648-1970(-)